MGRVQELTGKVRVTGIFPAMTQSDMSAGRSDPDEMIQQQDVAEAALLPFPHDREGLPVDDRDSECWGGVDIGC